MRGRDQQPLVIVFAESPEPGRVKRRLLPALRAREAADLYRAMLLDTIEVARATDFEVVIAYEATAGRRLLERLVGARTRLIPQPPGDLGVKLSGVSERLLGGRRRPTLFVCSDCPGIDVELLEQAAAALQRSDVIIGPAAGGGHYLIGFDRHRPELLTEIPWGTGDVLEVARRRAEASGLSVVALREERALETPADLLEWHAASRERDLEVAYPRTLHSLHAFLPPRRVSALESELYNG